MPAAFVISPIAGLREPALYHSSEMLNLPGNADDPLTIALLARRAVAACGRGCG